MAWTPDTERTRPQLLEGGPEGDSPEWGAGSLTLGGRLLPGPAATVCAACTPTPPERGTSAAPSQGRDLRSPGTKDKHLTAPCGPGVLGGGVPPSVWDQPLPRGLSWAFPGPGCGVSESNPSGRRSGGCACKSPHLPTLPSLHPQLRDEQGDALATGQNCGPWERGGAHEEETQGRPRGRGQVWGSGCWRGQDVRAGGTHGLGEPSGSSVRPAEKARGMRKCSGPGVQARGARNSLRACLRSDCRKAVGNAGAVTPGLLTFQTPNPLFWGHLGRVGCLAATLCPTHQLRTIPTPTEDNTAKRPQGTPSPLSENRCPRVTATSQDKR